MKILFFDGYCSLCNSSVDWVMRHDHGKLIQFASLQGETAKKILSQDLIRNLSSVVYLRNGEVLERSSAVLQVFRDLGWPWKAMMIFKGVPRWLRDPFYNFVARNRYRIIKKRDTCRVPTFAEKERILP